LTFWTPPEGRQCYSYGVFLLLPFKINLQMKAKRTVFGKSFIVLFFSLISSLFFSFSPRVDGFIRNSSTVVGSTAGAMIGSAARTAAGAAARFNLLYDSLGLDALELSRAAFEHAVKGFLALQQAGEIRNTDVLSIVDFSLPSNKKRLFVIDMANGRLLFNTFVAHGRNSGGLMATRFSNRKNSLMSSLGFYLTGDPFIGQHGYSLRLEGIEPGWNDHANRRAIIMHPADYVSEDHIRQWGLLGRSEGCPAIPRELDQPIIDEIKGGSCLFLYAPNKIYLQRSGLVS
jgi:L,D-transpeptidase catalytic domain